jgi:hypothetical protein
VPGFEDSAWLDTRLELTGGRGSSMPCLHIPQPAAPRELLGECYKFERTIADRFHAHRQLLPQNSLTVYSLRGTGDIVTAICSLIRGSKWNGTISEIQKVGERKSNLNSKLKYFLEILDFL